MIDLFMILDQTSLQDLPHSHLCNCYLHLLGFLHTSNGILFWKLPSPIACDPLKEFHDNPFITIFHLYVFESKLHVVPEVIVFNVYLTCQILYLSSWLHLNYTYLCLTFNWYVIWYVVCSVHVGSIYGNVTILMIL